MVYDWTFARRPGWLASHLFAVSVVSLFMFFSFGWQYPRHVERVAQNKIVESRAFADPLDVAEALSQPSPDELDFVAVSASGHFLDPALFRVANRTQNAQAGDWLVGLFETSDGQLLLVNRGFITREAVPDAVTELGVNGDTTILGWLRTTRVKERFGATDPGTGERVPRLDVDLLAQRFDVNVAPMWFQLESPTSGGFPDPVPLPPLNSGPHFSYAVQWFVFATLGVIVYGLLLRKQAMEHAKLKRRQKTPEPIEKVAAESDSGH